jgi:predicted small secreted protein
MKRSLSVIALSICISFLFSSCATVFGGRVSDLQRTKPAKGEPQRKIRVVALVADFLLCGGGCAIIDFATGAIYKPGSK